MFTRLTYNVQYNMSHKHKHIRRFYPFFYCVYMCQCFSKLMDLQVDEVVYMLSASFIVCSRLQQVFFFLVSCFLFFLQKKRREYIYIQKIIVVQEKKIIIVQVYLLNENILPLLEGIDYVTEYRTNLVSSLIVYLQKM